MAEALEEELQSMEAAGGVFQQRSDSLCQYGLSKEYMLNHIRDSRIMHVSPLVKLYWAFWGVRSKQQIVCLILFYHAATSSLWNAFRFLSGGWRKPVL